MIIPIRHALRGRLPGLLMVPLLLAAAPAPEDAPAEPPLAEREVVVKDAVLRVLGTEVKGPSGIVVGQIVNVLVDAGGQPIGAVLDYGGFLGVGKRRIGIAWSALGFDKGSISLSLSRDQLKNFPEYREGEDAVLATVPAPPG